MLTTVLEEDCNRSSRMTAGISEEDGGERRQEATTGLCVMA